MKIYDFDEETIWLNLVIAFALNIVYRILGYILLKMKYREKNTQYSDNPDKIKKYAIVSEAD